MNLTSNAWLDTAVVSGDLRTRSARGGAVTLAAQMLRFGLMVGSTALLSRLLNAEAFGLVAMVAALTNFVLVIRELGLSMPTIQRADITQDQVSALFWISMAVSVALGIITGAAAPLVAWFYGEPRLIPITLSLAASFVFGGLNQQHQALMRRQMQFGQLAWIDLGSMAVGVVVAAFAALGGLDYWALVLREVVTTGCSALFAWIACNWRPSRPRRTPGVGALLRFGGDLTVMNITGWVMRYADQVLIGKFAGAIPLGFYSRAFNLVMQPVVQINAPVSAVAIPAMSRIIDDRARVRRVYLQLVDAVALVTIPGIGFLIATAHEVIRVVLGPGWDESAMLFQLLAVASLTHPVANACSWLMTAEGRSTALMRVSVVGTAATIAAFAIGLHFDGARGVAAGYAISGLLVRTPYQLWAASKGGSVTLRDLLDALLAPCAAALAAMAVSFAVIRLTHLSPAATLTACFVAAAPATLLTLAVFPGGRRALRHVRDLVDNVVRRKAPAP